MTGDDDKGKVIPLRPSMADGRRADGARADAPGGPTVAATAAAATGPGPAAGHGAASPGAALAGFAQAAAAPPKQARRRSCDYLKFTPPDEARQRRRVAMVAAGCSVVFLAFAVVAALQKRSFAPLPVGSDLIIEAAMEVFPQAWPISVLHNLILAAFAALFTVAATVGHIGIPDDPRRPEIIVWRRTCRFAHPRVVPIVLLLGSGIALQRAGHPLLAAMFESPAMVMLLDVLAHLFLPLARPWLVMREDRIHEGLGNQLRIGGGLRRARGGSIVIPHHSLVEARMVITPWEWMFGLAGLHLRYVDRDERLASLTLRALASTAAVQHIEKEIMGDFTQTARLPATRRWPVPPRSTGGAAVAAPPTRPASPQQNPGAQAPR